MGLIQYKFTLTGNYVSIVNNMTNEIIKLIPVNLMILQKLDPNHFSINVLGDNAQLTLNWQDIAVPNYSTYIGIDEFLVDLAAICNVVIGGGGSGSVIYAGASPTTIT